MDAGAEEAPMQVTLQEGTAYVIVEEAKMFLWLEIDFIPVYFEGYYGTGNSNILQSAQIDLQTRVFVAGN